MNPLRTALKELGWPHEMSDQEIASELLRRWFTRADTAPLALSDVGIIARGAYTALLRAGQEQALWWEEPLPGRSRKARPQIDPIIDQQHSKHDDSDDDFILADRRRGRRRAEPALVQLSMDYGTRQSLGWLVDISTDGAGVLMEMLNTPSVGAQVESMVHQRCGRADRLGTGWVVRTEALAHDVGLIGVELEEPFDPRSA